MPETERKSHVSVEIKDAEKGIVRAVFAKLGVKDLDDDFTPDGAFGKQSVKVSAYGHESWMGALPVGKGTISEEKGEAVADLQFFMTTNHGREHFEVVKEMGDLQEWSYGFDVVETGEVTEALREKGVRRVLKKLKVHEVSPVLRGAGVDTRTLAVKEAPAEKGKENMGTKGTELGRLLKQLRDENELSNGDLAEAMHVSATIAGEYVDGAPLRPSLERLERAAKLLKTSLSRLRGAAENDGHDYSDEDAMRSRGAAAEEARAAALKAQELAESAEKEARAAIDAKTAKEAREAEERSQAFQEEAQAEVDRFTRSMGRYTV